MGRLSIAAIAFFLSLAPATAETGAVFKDCDVCPLMIVLPTGTARIGATDGDTDAEADEKPAFVRKLANPLAMGVHEVTNSEFSAFVAETSYNTNRNCRTFEDGKWLFRPGRWWGSPGYQVRDDLPVVCLEWADIVAYLTWLREKTSKPYRLPTEIEWEFAARAGTKTRFWYGDDPDYSQLCKFGNVAHSGFFSDPFDPGTVCFDGFEQTAPVGRFPANPFGLFDMIGNVIEWTADCYVNSDPYNPRTFISSEETAHCLKRTHRGGSWLSSARFNRTTNRGTHRFNTQNSDVGFRVVRPYEVFVSAVD